MAKKIMTSPEVLRVVNAAIATGAWICEGRCGKHNKLRHVASGRMVAFAVTPGDSQRGPLNLKSEIRKVESGRPGWGIATC